MRFKETLKQAKLIRRYKRFLADVEWPDGSVVTATCPNTGSLLGATEPGLTIYLSKSDSPTRKYAYTWHLTDRPGIGLVGIDTSLPNRIVEETILAKAIPQLAAYSALRREVKYGVNSRIDLLLEGEGLPACYVEVKNVTFIRTPGLAEFPDCVTTRGTKHLRELTAMVHEGHRAVMVYLVQCESPTHFSLTRDLDPVYVDAFIAARKAGVEAIALTCHMSPDTITVKTRIPILHP